MSIIILYIINNTIYSWSDLISLRLIIKVARVVSLKLVVKKDRKTIYKKITRVEVVVSKSAFKLKFGQDEYAEVKWEKQLKQLIQEKLIKQDKLPRGSLSEITL